LGWPTSASCLEVDKLWRHSSETGTVKAMVDRPADLPARRPGPATFAGTTSAMLARAGDEAKIGFECAGQQGHRYPNAAGLSRPSLDQLDHALRGAGPGQVQEYLGERVEGRTYQLLPESLRSQQRGGPDNEAAGMYSDVIYAFSFGLGGAILFLLVDKYEKSAVAGNLLKFSILAVCGLAILHKLLGFNWF
jgi:hypothetical protein